MLSFVTALLTFTFAQFVLVLALSKFDLGPRINKVEDVLAYYANRIAILLFIPYALITAYSAISGTIPTFWLLLYALITGVLVLASLVNKSSNPVPVVLALSIPIAVMLMSLLIIGPMPTGQDEGRFAGFAYAIMRDGRWQAGVYAENTYYQFFHIVPYIMATISTITGLDLIYFGRPLTMLVVTLVVIFDIYVIVRNLIGRQRRIMGILGPILLFSTPPIAASSFIPQTLAVTFYLTVLMLLSIGTTAKADYAKFLAVFLISVIGVATHAIYPILLLSTLIPVLLASSNRKNQPIESHLLKSITYVVLILTFAYWTYSLAIDQLVSTSKTMIQSLMDLLTGQIEPFRAGRQVWYSTAPFQLAYSWVLLLGLAAAYIFTQLLNGVTTLKNVKKLITHLKGDWLVTVAITGILWLGTALITRASFGGWSVRYFYPFYILLIPASAVIIGKIAGKKRIINTAIIVVMVAAASFYAIQDPMLSPGGSNVLMSANKRTWIVAESLAVNVSLDTKYDFDPRVSIPFVAITIKSTPELYYSPLKQSYEANLIVLNLDDLGKQWASYWFDDHVLQGIANSSYNIVYTDGLYRAWYLHPET